MRVTSDRAATNGGWLHPLDATAKNLPRRTDPAPPTIDCAALMTRWEVATAPAWRQDYAKELGVSLEAIHAMAPVWARDFQAWAWAMKDSIGKVIGIRLRNRAASKWCVPGSRTGIFLPTMPPPKRLTIVEGNTDCAAALSLGLFVIGRPSCLGGVEIILDYIRRNSVREVVIVADNDPKQRPDGTPWNPGMEGAEILQRQLPVPSVMLTMPAKDLRASVQAGMNRATFDCLLNGQIWHQPKTKRS